MLASIILGSAIFGYATYALIKFINKSKKGKCSTCALESTCSSKCDSQAK